MKKRFLLNETTSTVESMQTTSLPLGRNWSFLSLLSPRALARAAMLACHRCARRQLVSQQELARHRGTQPRSSARRPPKRLRAAVRACRPPEFAPAPQGRTLPAASARARLRPALPAPRQPTALAPPRARRTCSCRTAPRQPAALAPRRPSCVPARSPLLAPAASAPPSLTGHGAPLGQASNARSPAAALPRPQDAA